MMPSRLSAPTALCFGDRVVIRGGSKKLPALILGLVLAAWLLVSCTAPVIVTPTPLPPSPTPRPTLAVAPGTSPYAAPGPYPVNIDDFNIWDGDILVIGRIWVPDAQATPGTLPGPFPLVVASVGLGGDVNGLDSLGKHMASYGFVIMAANPRGEFMNGDFWEGAVTRPQDILRLIAYAEKETAPGGAFAGLIDTGRIGMWGHSSGGWAALVGGGAQMDLGWCAVHPDLVAKYPISDCTQFPAHQQEIAKMLGLPSVPGGLWPAMNDPRVQAVIAVSPDGDIWGTEYGGMASLKVPTIIFAGSADDLNAPELCAYPMYAHLGSPKKTLAVFDGGNHFVVSDSRTIDIYNHLVIAFLLAELKGDETAARALAPANATFAGVRIETTAYNIK